MSFSVLVSQEGNVLSRESTMSARPRWVRDGLGYFVGVPGVGSSVEACNEEGLVRREASRSNHRLFHVGDTVGLRRGNADADISADTDPILIRNRHTGLETCSHTKELARILWKCSGSLRLVAPFSFLDLHHTQYHTALRTERPTPAMSNLNFTEASQKVRTMHAAAGIPSHHTCADRP